jgi:hypothetical protein
MYEICSLAIKLVSALNVSAGLISGMSGVLMSGVLLVLWLQDGICKTFQSRIGTRLLKLEAYIAAGDHDDAMQLHSEFERNRRGGLSLIAEYALQSLRPTVAFSHLSLILILAVDYLMGLAQ